MSILYEAISSFIDLKVNRECLVSWIDKDALFTSYIDLLDEEIKAGNKKYKLVRQTSSCKIQRSRIVWFIFLT